ncbi:MAG: hypothetical protein KatS3mg002_1441 [Candidatus Woesearchaeota archaeon]|nr:MAG: hypothetical protein KatS3mg002_1441 [Candidatus Woesearchaeota archaeon]
MSYRLTKIERDIEELKFEDDIIKKDIEKIRRDLIDKTPEHFNQKDILRAFMGSLFLAFSVAFSSNILNAAKTIPDSHIKFVILFTITILVAEIYFIGYQRVENKQKRKFGQFCVKRLTTFYLVSILVSIMITYIFGLVYLVDTPEQYYKLVLIISAPASIGASISDLLKKY